MRIGVVAGEPSGDLLAASVLEALRRRHPDLQVEGVGGPHMEALGLKSLVPMERLSVMGFLEPFKRLPELFRIRRRLLRFFTDNPPDVFLGVDSPDFNLALERKLRRRGVTTVHLVSPSVWAWRRGRVRNIARSVDLMLCLFPFETDIYRQKGIPVCFVGHPLADELATEQDIMDLRTRLGLEQDKKVLALLPGSREEEVRRLAPLFFQAARLLHRHLPELTFVVPAVSAVRERELRRQLVGYEELQIAVLSGQSREAMGASDAVLLASGTASLEAALLGRPMVVTYRMSAVSWQLIKRMVTTPFAALPNIIAGEALVPELLQHAATPEAMAAAMLPLLQDPDAAAQQTRGFQRLRDTLRQGFAERAAEALDSLAGNQAHG